MIGLVKLRVKKGIFSKLANLTSYYIVLRFTIKILISHIVRVCYRNLVLWYK